jgi:hypothetical protein
MASHFPNPEIGMNFPYNCIKGIPNSNFLLEDGSVGSHLFYFKPEHAREDGWIEQSINWEDDESVIEFTLEQRREDGERQFRAGVVIVPREEIDGLNARPTVNGVLSYERQRLENNPYHGNILLRIGLPKPTMKKIAAGLALAISEIIPYQD